MELSPVWGLRHWLTSRQKAYAEERQTQLNNRRGFKKSLQRITSDTKEMPVPGRHCLHRRAWLVSPTFLTVALVFPPEVDGIMESWVLKLATALKSNLIDVNVVITDWLSLAQTHYPTAAKSTRSVGKDIAHLLQALQVNPYPCKKKKQNTSITTSVITNKQHG